MGIKASPERALGREELDARTDLLSFGGVLYEMATAFPGGSSAVIFHAILGGTLVSPSSLIRELPLDFDRIIYKALEKDREVRYHASELRADLSNMGATPLAIRPIWVKLCDGAEVLSALID